MYQGRHGGDCDECEVYSHESHRYHVARGAHDVLCPNWWKKSRNVKFGEYSGTSGWLTAVVGRRATLSLTNNWVATLKRWGTCKWNATYGAHGTETIVAGGLPRNVSYHLTLLVNSFAKPTIWKKIIIILLHSLKPQNRFLSEVAIINRTTLSHFHWAWRKVMDIVVGKLRDSTLIKAVVVPKYKSLKKKSFYDF